MDFFEQTSNDGSGDDGAAGTMIDGGFPASTISGDFIGFEGDLPGAASMIVGESMFTEPSMLVVEGREMDVDAESGLFMDTSCDF